MHSNLHGSQYEQALTLADSGQHEQALRLILSYLNSHPTDAQALNDAGTILYCLKRGREAIGFLEKAMHFSSEAQRQQISWNLCEVYLTESYPEKAMELFGKMQKWGTLNADTVNRTAELFVNQNKVGKAVQALSLSTRMVTNQRVLEPMIQLLRSKRCRAVIFSDRDRPMSRMLNYSLNKWMPTDCCVSADAEQVQKTIQSADISIFIGCGVSLVWALKESTKTKKIVIVDEQDIYGPMIGLLDQRPLDAVIACASPQAIEDLNLRTGHSNIVPAEAVPEPQMMPLFDRRQGLRIAAVGPWNLRQNPMFLLQCFQKFNYIHPDSRLYLGGPFEDPGLKRYLQHAAEAMDLENVVFFDESINNWEKWFKDKHIVASAAVDASGMSGVWMAMACGLKPAMLRFAGAETMLPEAFIFDYSEEFCQLAESDDNQPEYYRQMVSGRFEEVGLALKVHSEICDLEEKLQTPPSQVVPEPAQTVNRFQPPQVSQPISDEISYHSLCSEINQMASEINSIGSIN
jgi:tetratricopeptide (TPR) repeat protein